MHAPQSARIAAQDLPAVAGSRIFNAQKFLQGIRRAPLAWEDVAARPAPPPAPAVTPRKSVGAAYSRFLDAGRFAATMAVMRRVRPAVDRKLAVIARQSFMRPLLRPLFENTRPRVFVVRSEATVHPALERPRVVAQTVAVAFSPAAAPAKSVHSAPQNRVEARPRPILTLGRKATGAEAVSALMAKRPLSITGEFRAESRRATAPQAPRQPIKGTLTLSRAVALPGKAATAKTFDVSARRSAAATAARPAARRNNARKADLKDLFREELRKMEAEAAPSAAPRPAASFAVARARAKTWAELEAEAAALAPKKKSWDAQTAALKAELKAALSPQENPPAPRADARARPGKPAGLKTPVAA